MQIIENWADVTARVVAVHPHPQLAGYASVTLAVTEVRPVPGFANLFESANGQTIDVNVPAAELPSTGVDDRKSMSWRVRKAGPASNFAQAKNVGS